MKITMQEPIFTTDVRVRYGDTDAAGIVYNANYFRYFEIGRSEMMRAWACSYREIEEVGFYLPVTECFSRFKAPAHYDDLLTIETCVSRIRKISCCFNYRITRTEPDQQRPKLLVKGYTIHASVDKNGKLTELPSEITAKLQSLIKRGEE